MKDRWCGNYQAGKCLVTEGDTPSLAERYTEEVQKGRPEVITDPFRIVSILSFLDPDKLKGDGEIPKEITVVWPDVETQQRSRCLASNCRSKQRTCDKYR
jgi:hypothetical protein